MRFKIIMIAALFLAACDQPAAPAKYTGKWESNGETLQLLEDGKALVESSGGPASGTWRPDGHGGITASLDSEGKTVLVQMHMEDGKLVSTYNGVSGTFSRVE